MFGVGSADNSRVVGQFPAGGSDRVDQPRSTTAAASPFLSLFINWHETCYPRKNDRTANGRSMAGLEQS